jgi:phage/plasmid-like protein (TIGR03299 family)
MAHGITDTDSMFSVRAMPWHGLGAVLDDYPTSIDDALRQAGLGWTVEQRPIYVHRDGPVTAVNGGSGVLIAPGGFEELRDADDVRYVANVRSDTDQVLGVVTSSYKVVGNREAFEFLDALIGSDLYFETAGSLWGGKRVWVLARLPDYVEVGGDQSATYVYCSNAHDGSMAVTAAATSIRIVCANTLGAADRRAEVSPRTFRFRHTGDLAVKFAEARRVMDLTLDWEAAWQELGDRMALEPLSDARFERDVVRPLFPFHPELTKRQAENRERSVAKIIDIWHGRGPAGDTRGNSPRTKWAAYNAIAEHADFGRRTTKRTNQVARSFEDVDLKRRALALVRAI